MTEFITHSPEETIALGKKIGRLLRGGDVIAYVGGLGCGKTTITRGISIGLGLRVAQKFPTANFSQTSQVRT